MRARRAVLTSRGTRTLRRHGQQVTAEYVVAVAVVVGPRVSCWDVDPASEARITNPHVPVAHARRSLSTDGADVPGVDHGRVPGIVDQLLEIDERIDSQGGSPGEHLANLHAIGRGRTGICEQAEVQNPAMITHVHNSCRDPVEILSDLYGVMLRCMMHGRQS